MKAILPVAGVGTRLRPLTHTTPKALVHVAGKPILGHILDALIPLGIDEVVLIVGYLGEQVVEYVRSTYPLRVKFVEQPERKGLGHAIYLAKEQVPNDEPILIVLGDTIFQADLAKVLAGRRSAIGVREVEDPTRFGVVEMDGGSIKKLVEKPAVPPSNLAIVGVYYLTSSQRLFASLQEVIDRDIKVKGEYQLTDALQIMIEQGEEMGVFKVDDWLDCGNPETLLLTNQVLLNKQNGHLQPPNLPGCIVIPPVYIAPSAQVDNSIIGPYASIAEGADVRNSILRNSIVNRHAQVENVLLTDSIIGERAAVGGTYTVLNVGDSSDISIAR